MKQRLYAWFALIPVIFIAIVFFYSMSGGGSVSKDPLYTDLKDFPMYVKRGFVKSAARDGRVTVRKALK